MTNMAEATEEKDSFSTLVDMKVSYGKQTKTSDGGERPFLLNILPN